MSGLGVARETDWCDGCPSCPIPRQAIEGSPDVYCNMLPVHRVTDAWEVHCGHSAELEHGCPNVLVNGLDCGRCTDPITCGAEVVTCSEDTFCDCIPFGI